MKKEISLTMACAMAFGTVVPAFASEGLVQNTRTTKTTEEVNVLKALGVKKVETKTRAEIYNYNGATAEETDKHTLKTDYKGSVILGEVKDSDKDANNDKFVVGLTDEVSLKQAKVEKAKYDAMLKEIKVYTEDLGYKVVKGYNPEVAKGEMTGEAITEAFSYTNEIKAESGLSIKGAGAIGENDTLHMQGNTLTIEGDTTLEVKGTIDLTKGKTVENTKDRLVGKAGAKLVLGEKGKIVGYDTTTFVGAGTYEWVQEEGEKGDWKKKDENVDNTTPSTVQKREVGSTGVTKGVTEEQIEGVTEDLFFNKVIKLQKKENDKVVDEKTYVFNNMYRGNDFIEEGLVAPTDVESFIKEAGLEESKGVDISKNEIKIHLAEKKEDGKTTEETVKSEDLVGIKDSNVYVTINRLKYALEKQGKNIEVVKDEFGNNKHLKIKVKFKQVTKDSATTTEKEMVINLYHYGFLDKSKIVELPNLDKSDFKGHWAEETILKAMVSGYVDASATFRPKDGVTRAEFTKMLCTVFGVDVENLGNKFEPFTDVNQTDWYYKYVVALYNKEGVGTIINGYEDGTFKPNAKITRQEAAKMVASMYLQSEDKLREKLSVENKDGSLVNVSKLDTDKEKVKSADYNIVANGMKFEIDSKTSFADDKDIKNWADGSVASLNKVSVINGYADGTFRPQGEITRVEALLMITGDNRNK